jgi:hypothetical protein
VKLDFANDETASTTTAAAPERTDTRMVEIGHGRL